MTDTELEHAGKKGMKWGVRKDRPPVKLSRDHKRAAKLKQKSIVSLNNDELKELTNRMQLEKKYRELKPGSFSKGQKQVAGVLAIGATANAVISFINSPAGKLIKKAFEKKPIKGQLSLGK